MKSLKVVAALIAAFQASCASFNSTPTADINGDGVVTAQEHKVHRYKSQANQTDRRDESDRVDHVFEIVERVRRGLKRD